MQHRLFGLHPINNTLTQIGGPEPKVFTGKEDIMTVVDSHVKAWKYYKVRADSGKTLACKAEFCQYNEAHGDYVYTVEWVDFLVRQLSDDDTYKKVLAYK